MGRGGGEISDMHLHKAARSIHFTLTATFQVKVLLIWSCYATMGTRVEVQCVHYSVVKLVRAQAYNNLWFW